MLRLGDWIDEAHRLLREIAKLLPPTLYRKVRQIARRRTRKAIAMGYYGPPLSALKEWVGRDTETANFYYQLTELNRDHLAHFMANLTGRPYAEIIGYFTELETDVDLRSHLQAALSSADYGRDIKVEYGRRLGWYAFVRALKPAVVIETGVDHGVGSCVLASALLRNIEEGHAGSYFGTELRTEAGQLFSGKYAAVGQILYGDSIESLRRFEQPIDLFINDSDHSGTYEYDEYQVIGPKLSPHGVIFGDNAHVTDSLSRYSRETGRTFSFFSEKPKDHWYPGAGIGVSTPA